LTEIIEVTSFEQFTGLVAEGPVVVDYWADWCGPCKKFAPHYESAAEKSTLDLTFASVDVEANEWAIKREGIMQIPTVRLYYFGKVLDTKSRTVVPFLNELTTTLGG